MNAQNLVMRLSALSLVALMLSAGCGSGSPCKFVPADTQEELAAAIVGGATGSGSLALLRTPLSSKLADLLHFLDPFPLVEAANSCPAFSSSLCSGGSSVTLTYNSCLSTGGNNGTWTGSQTLAFGSNAQCLAGVPVSGVGNSLTRTFSQGATVTVGEIQDSAACPMYGGTDVLDTSTPSGNFSPQVSGGFTVTGVTGGHTLAVNGVHLVVNTTSGNSHSPYSTGWTFTTNAAYGGSLLNVTIPTPGSAARTITSGTLVVSPGNVMNFSNVTWNGTSCFPQSGTITSTVTGSPSTSLKFTGNGNAAQLWTDGNTYNIVLRHCL